MNETQLSFSKLQKKCKIISKLLRNGIYEYSMIRYDTIKNYYIYLDKDKNIVHVSRMIDVDIDKYIKDSTFKDSEFDIWSSWLSNRMKSTTLIKPIEVYFL